MKQCSTCGKEFQADWNVCPKCGMKAGIRHDERPSSVTVARGIALAVVIAIIIAFIFFDPYMVCAVLFIAFAVSLIIYGAFLKQNELRFYERYGGKHPKK